MRKSFRALLGAAVATVALGAAALFAATPASAAALTEVTNFGNNPTKLRMYVYVPDRRPANPALLVAVHYCTGSGPAFHNGSQFASLADRYGFVIVYPSTTRTGNCFDVSSPGAFKHDGNSDPAGIASMVRYAQQQYRTDTSRTFVTGASSGAMMTNVLLGDYPDLFKAGAAFSGVPFGCFAASAGDPTNPANQSGWNSDCAGGRVTRTAQQWGDLVRNAYPGYTGPRPRMQLWHGATDSTLAYPNFAEEIKQWTNVLGVSSTPARTDSPQSGWTRTRYGSTSAQAPVEAISIAGVGHNLPLSGQAALAVTFFGLDGSAPTTPPVSSPPVSSPPVSSPPVSSPPVSSPPVSSPPVSSPPVTGGCSATVTNNAWTGGFVSSIKVTAGAAAINGWRVGLTLPGGSAVTSSWSSTVTGSTGAVSFGNVSYNGSLAPGGTAEFGFQGTGTPPAGALTCTAS